MEQLSTGKKINQPSDDPVVAMRGVDYRSELSKVEQFERNMSEVRTWMDSSDEAMDEAGQSLMRVRELVTQASNDSYEENQRENMASEVEQIKDHLIELANTKVNNKHIFNGTHTDTPRFDNNGNLSGESNNKAINIEVSDGVELRANVDPSNAFSENMIQGLENIVTDLRDNNTTGDDLDGYLSDIDQYSQNIVDERADLGARMNRAELIETRLSQQEITTKDVMSSNEDADMSEVITNLRMQENVHRAALSAGSRIIQPTLMDFLR
ncbi:flagellar hook-associated protein 3 FlgL [Alkalibacillus flavidus]|uniref:Flagellar hook-associated protein 3 FlgL n=2 Tax=Alkalibacillus flavidus TaxID=546021 RepID=A0ABV2KTS7_9BACI